MRPEDRQALDEANEEESARKHAARTWPLMKHFAEGGDVGTYDSGHFYRHSNPNWEVTGLEKAPEYVETWVWVLEKPGPEYLAQRSADNPWPMVLDGRVYRADNSMQRRKKQ